MKTKKAAVGGEVINHNPSKGAIGMDNKKNITERKITDSTEYTVEKMKFIVSPFFKTEGIDTLKTTLLRIIKTAVDSEITA